MLCSEDVYCHDAFCLINATRGKEFSFCNAFDCLGVVNWGFVAFSQNLDTQLQIPLASLPAISWICEHDPYIEQLVLILKIHICQIELVTTDDLGFGQDVRNVENFDLNDLIL